MWEGIVWSGLPGHQKGPLASDGGWDQCLPAGLRGFLREVSRNAQAPARGRSRRSAQNGRRDVLSF